MSCSRWEEKFLGYVDGRLKEGERREMEKHLSTCAACQLRVNEFREVNVLLDELPMIEPSAAFDIRVHARVAAEPAKQSWWAWFTPSPRIALAASMLLLATVWLGSRPVEHPAIPEQDLPVVNSADYEVISSFAPLADLSQAASDDDDASDSNAPKQM
ncbi:MAG TPA: zf-HC2 domain-containing protein [Candidatus Acidoferrum sp.]|nr:zf-HC2 domain-containing protein [Candidatus Acidoferrum sp.]